MRISRLGVKDSKKYYPIISFKILIIRKNSKYDYIITALSNSKKEKLVFKQMLSDGFNVKHIRNRIISGGSCVHDFGLILDDYYNDVTRVMMESDDYKIIQVLSSELRSKLNI